MRLQIFLCLKGPGSWVLLPLALAAWLTQGFLTFPSSWEGDDQFSKSCDSTSSSASLDLTLDLVPAFPAAV